MFKVLNFFKSYKVDMLNTNTILKFDDKLENKIKMIDDIFFKYLFNKTDRFNIDDFIDYLNIKLNPSERITPEDKIYMDISIWVKKIFESRMEYRDELIEKFITFIFSENGNLKHDEIFSYKYSYEKKLIIKMDDHVVDNMVYLTLKDYINLEDVMYRE
jgi:hypothetical protein